MGNNDNRSLTPIRERVAVLVDVQNLFHSSISSHDGKVNYSALLETAVSGRTLAKAVAYVVATEEGKEKPFFSALRHAGFEVKSRPLQVYDGGRHMKGNWDVGMAVDAIDFFLDLAVDTVVLASGDGDFVELVQFLQKKGIKVEILSFRESTSGNLMRTVDKFTDLSDDPKRFILGRQY